MKRANPAVHIKNLNITFMAPPPPRQSLLEPKISVSMGHASRSSAPSDIPALGAYWPGQGGLNGGLVHAHGDVPAHYKIIAKEDVGAHAWGPRGKESGAISKTDGMANTIELCGGDDKYPAASACAEYQADGHHDFYLPACAELYHCWVNVPDLFAKDCYYWSSSQRSAHYAFFMHFADGYQINDDEDYELRVRPVRRLFI